MAEVVCLAIDRFRTALAFIYTIVVIARGPTRDRESAN